MKKMIIEEINKQLSCAGIGEYELIETNCSKPNGMSYNGLVIKLPSCDTCPTVNLDQVEEMATLSPEKTLEQIVEQVMDVFVPALRNPHHFNMEWFTEYENVKSRLFLGVCNIKGNEAFLSKVPHFLMEDLALYARVLVEAKETDGIGAITVYSSHLEFWQITDAQLFMDAKLSTVNVLPLEIVSMSSLMNAFLEEMGDEMFNIEKPEEPVEIWICTNERKIEGASVVAYPGFYDKVKECTGWDEFYVLPSSRHEVLVYPKESRTLEDEVMETAYVEGMIEQGNTLVHPCELLSYFAYKFDANGNFSIAATNRKIVITA